MSTLDKLYTIQVKNVLGDISERGEYTCYETAKNSLIYWAHAMLTRHEASIRENRPVYNDQAEMSGWYMDFGGHNATLSIVEKQLA